MRCEIWLSATFLLEISEAIETPEQQEEIEEETIVEEDIIEEEPEQEVAEADTEGEVQEIESDIELVEEVAENTEESTEQIDITTLDKIMCAQSEVNTRLGDSTDYEKVGSLTKNQEVHVIGQSNSTGWYQIDTDSAVVFASDKYLADSKVEIQEPAQADAASNSNQTSTAGYTQEALAILEKNGVSPELATRVGLTSESILFFDSIGQPISITDNSTARVIPEGYTADGIPISEVDYSGLEGITATLN